MYTGLWDLPEFSSNLIYRVQGPGILAGSDLNQCFSSMLRCQSDGRETKSNSFCSYFNAMPCIQAPQFAYTVLQASH